jgi:hypothetical protein
MNARMTLLLLGLAASALGVIYFSRKPAPENPAPDPVPVTTATSPATETVAPPPISLAQNESPAPAESVPAAPPVKKIPAQNPGYVNNSTNPAPPAKPALQDPDARVALSLVGADPDAEAYWMDAIFDTSLPDQEREDLMEDLNEDGLSDPKHPGPQDLPLILNRLALIEEIAPSADPFMQEHLGEAYKDLNNMLAGKPVQ